MGKFDVKMNNSNVLDFRFGKTFRLHSLIDVNIAVFLAYQLLQPVCFGLDHSLKINFRLSVLISAGMKGTALSLYESRKMLNSVSTFCTDNIMCVCRSVVWVSSDSLHHHNHEDSVKAILFFLSVPFMFFIIYITI